jgi:hypothetical protein
MMSAASFLTNGSPPVSLILFTPFATNTLAMDSIYLLPRINFTLLVTKEIQEY